MASAVVYWMPACAGMTGRAYGRTAGVSTGMPRARHIR